VGELEFDRIHSRAYLKTGGARESRGERLSNMLVMGSQFLPRARARHAFARRWIPYIPSFDRFLRFLREGIISREKGHRI
jgi:hypothetical protein